MKGRTGVSGGRAAGWLMSAGALLAAYALVVAWSGGFDVRLAGVRLPVRSR